ncbi:MAG: lipid-A-disaccharide synthase N-terminal domain-containing protein [Phycisphaerae bacterium]
MATSPPWRDRLVKTLIHPLALFGFGAQFLFMMRFLVQWIASERKKRSYVPVAFWYFSLGGGALLLIYAIQRRDPVFIMGQSLGLLIYSRNLYLIYRRAGIYRDRLADRRSMEPSTQPTEPASAV